MRTNIDIDEGLMREAMEVLGTGTKRDTVMKALQEAVRIKRQLQALESLRGSGWYGNEEEVRGNRYTVDA